MTLTVEASGGLPIIYEWYKNDIKLKEYDEAVLHIESVTPGDAGTYYCEVSNKCGYNSSNNIIVTVEASTVDEADGKNITGFQVSPNPVSNKAVVKFFIEKPGIVELSIKDLLGRDICPPDKSYHYAGQNEIAIPTDIISADGIYFIVIRNGGETYTEKIEINR